MSRWGAMQAVVEKDLTAVRRSKAVMLPMLLVPTRLLIVLPFGVGLAARAQDALNVESVLRALPANVARPILERPEHEQLIVLVNGYLIAQGEVVVVNDKFGIRLTDIITPSERIRKLKR